MHHDFDVIIAWLNGSFHKDTPPNFKNLKKELEPILSSLAPDLDRIIVTLYQDDEECPSLFFGSRHDPLGHRSPYIISLIFDKLDPDAWFAQFNITDPGESDWSKFHRVTGEWFKRRIKAFFIQYKKEGNQSSKSLRGFGFYFADSNHERTCGKINYSFGRRLEDAPLSDCEVLRRFARELPGTPFEMFQVKNGNVHTFDVWDVDVDSSFFKKAEPIAKILRRLFKVESIHCNHDSYEQNKARFESLRRKIGARNVKILSEEDRRKSTDLVNRNAYTTGIEWLCHLPGSSGIVVSKRFQTEPNTEYGNELVVRKRLKKIGKKRARKKADEKNASLGKLKTQYKLVYSDARSKKFWSIKLKGASHTVTFGRVGTVGQSKTKEFDTKEQARRSFEKLVDSKIEKGYVETIRKKK